jgi:RNA 2',3'-cyclic 3'-phosphodiesterase
VSGRPTRLGVDGESGQEIGVSEQFSLFDAEPPPADRLFFGVYPDAATAGRIAEQARTLRSATGLKGQLLATDRFHITLHEIGLYAGLPRGIVDKALEAGAKVAASPFEVSFDRVGSFNNRGNNPFVLQGGEGLGDLIAFQRALGLAMAGAGLGRQVARSFTPHVTLLYDRLLVAEAGIPPIRWAVSEFVLIHSLVGQTRHIPLARWTLG